MGQRREDRREETIASRIPNVDPPFTTQQVDDAELEEQLRLDEASREEPPPIERVIDSENEPPEETSVVDRVNP